MEGLAAVALALVGLLVVRAGLPPYDDAFFFVRVARNTLSAGVPAWNLADGPVYGNTSQLQQLWATAVLAVAPHHVVALSRLAAAAAVAAAFLLCPRRDIAVFVFLGPVALATVTTGMETALVLGLGAAFLASLGRGTPRGEAAAVGIGGLLYLARPDTGLLTVGTLLLTGRLGPALSLLGVVGAELVALHAVYGTPLPTAFATKLGLNDAYDATFLDRSRAAKLRHVLFFLWTLTPLLPALFAGVRRSGPARPLALVAAAFVAWHLAATTDVMGMHARFYAPALPWLAWAAATQLADRSLDLPSGPDIPTPAVWNMWSVWLLGWACVVAGLVHNSFVPNSEGWAIGRVHPATYVAHVAVAAWLLSRRGWPGAAMLAAVGVWLALPPQPRSGPDPSDLLGRPTPWRTDRAHADAYAAQVTSFRGLSAVARCLPPDVQVWHSEIGVPGIVLPDAHVTDLGGLMSPPVSADHLDAVCLDERPDVLFLPHRNYRSAHRALRDGRCVGGYERVVDRGSSPMYVRAEHLPQLLPCLRDTPL